MRVAAQPGLYDPTAGAPSLTGSRCSACGRVAFPVVAIGCDACGAEESSLQDIDLGSSGTLHSFATVYLHQGDLEPPFTIGEVQLDVGPLIRVTMASGDPEPVIGEPVRAIWRVSRIDEHGDEVVEPVFIGSE